ncbi:MAG: right-handed parallel beta-helix repeat-containing protein [Pseudomonadota bacterium]
MWKRVAGLICGAFLVGWGGAGLAQSATDIVPASLIPDSYVPHYECARDFYVDPNRGGADGDGSAAHPWKSVQEANDAQSGSAPVLRGGDCVNLGPGLYAPQAGVTLTHGGNANAPNGYVVYRSSTPHGAHLLAARKFYAMIDVKTAYVILDGLEIDGNNATNDGEGVAVSGDAAHHHIVVENCVIHAAGGGGVQMNDSEYFWVVGNIIYRNALTNTYQESGISIYQPQAASAFTATPADEALPFHIIIAGNRVRDNVELYDCAADHLGCHTDGNGIIIDKTLNVDRANGAPYAGRTLVVGNVVAHNGGGGVHVYLSEHVTVANNTTFNNRFDVANNGTWRGELSNVDSSDVTWVNNIAWAQPGETGVLEHNSPILVANTPGHTTTNVTWTTNIIFGADPRVEAPGYRLANQISRNPGLIDAFQGDLRLVPSSRARRAGTPQPYLTNATPNIGAY